MKRLTSITSRCSVRGLFRVLAICVVCGLDAIPVHASSDSDALRLDSILKDMQAYDKQLSTIWVKYRVTEYESSKFNTARTNRRAFSKSESAVKTFPELKFEVEAELAIKGNLVRTSDVGPEICGGRFVRDKFECVSVYDGEKTVKLQDEETEEDNPRPVYKLTRERERAFGYADPLNLCGQRYLLDVLDLWQSKKVPLIVTVRDEGQANAEPLVYVELKSTKDATLTKAWLLRDCGYRVKRLEQYFGDGTIAYKYSNITYQQVDGVCYPKTAVNQVFSASGDLLRESKLDVLSVTTRPTEIPNSLFKLEIPSGAALYDMDRQVMVRDPARVQSYIDEIVAPRFYRQPWFRICLCLGAIATLSCIFVYRQIGRRRSAFAK
jgi:hypothetical protein